MRDAVKILGTRLWIRHVFWLSGDTMQTFLGRFVDYASPRSEYGIKPNLVLAWERGTHAVSLGSVRRVESRTKGSAHIFLLLALLSRKRMSAPAVLRLMKDYIVTWDDGSRTWRFPNDTELKQNNRLPALDGWDDSAGLVARGDFFGMLAILALAREAAAQFRNRDLERHAANLYRLLPAIVRLPWVKPDVDLLLQCTDSLIDAIHRFAFRPKVSWALFRAYVQAPTYELNPRFWLRDPMSQDFLNKPGDVVLDSRTFHEMRPVPLLPDVEPLATYVIWPKPGFGEQWNGKPG